MANEAVTKIIYDATGAKQGAADFQTASQKIVDANRAVEQSEQKTTATVVDAATKRAAARKASTGSQGANGEVAAAAAAADAWSKSTDRIVVSLTRQQQILDRVTRQVDPFAAAARRAQKDVDDLNRIIAGGGAKAEDAAKLLGAAQQRLADALKVSTGAANDNAQAHATLSSQGQAALHSIRSMAEQAALGVSPVQLLTQQLGHLSYAASGPGGLKAALGEAVGVLAKLASGPGLIVGALGLIAGGFALVAARALATESSLRQFNVQLSSIGNGSSATAEGLEEIVRFLRDTGSSAEDAKKSVQALIQLKPQGLDVSAGNVKGLTTLGRDIAAGAGRGTTGVQETEALGKAVTSGTDALIKYAAELGALKGPELDYVLQLQRQGDANKAAIVILNDLIRLYDGKFHQSLGATTLLLEELSKAWNQALDALANSDFAQGFIRGLTDVIKSITETIGKLKDLYDWVNKFTGGELGKPIVTAETVAHPIEAVQKAAEGATKEAVKARDDLAQALRERGAAPNDIAGVTGGALNPQVQVETDNTHATQANSEAVKGLTEAVKQQKATTSSSATSPTAMAPWSGEISGKATVSPDLVASKAGQYGLSAAFANAVADIESSHGANLGSRGNVYQLGATERASVGATNLGSATDQVDYGLRFLAKTRDDLANKLGRQVSDAEIYLAHQQGVAGAAALIQNPNKPAGEVVPPANISANRGNPNASAQDFINQWTARVNRGVAGFGAQSNSSNFSGTVIDQNGTATQRKNLDDLTKADQRQTEAMQGLGVQQRLNAAFTQRYNEVIDQGLPKWTAWAEGNKALDEEQKRINIDVGKSSELAGMQVAGTRDVTKATLDSAEAGIRAGAAADAQRASIMEGIPVQQKYDELLNQGSADAVKGAAEQLRAMDPVIAAAERSAEAAKKGAAAEHEVAIENQAAALTYEAVNKVKAAGVAVDEQTIANINKEILARLKLKDALEQTAAAERLIHDLKDQSAVVSLEGELVARGATTGEIQKQVDLLLVKQRIERDFPNLSEDEKNKIIAATTALGDQKIKLQEIEQEQQRITELWRGIGDTIASSVGGALDDLFSGKKVDWGSKIKSLVQDIGKQIIQGTIVKPLIGSILEGLGQKNAATSFGSLFGSSDSNSSAGGLLGGLGKFLGNIFGTSSSKAASSALSNFEGTGLSAGDVAAVSADEGQALRAFEAADTSFFKGITNFFKPLTSLFGSSTGVVSGLGTFSGELGIAGDITSAADFTSAGAEGLGLSGLLGGIGSALGPIGAIAAIAIPLISSLFGNKKPSNFASGDVIDLASGKVSDFRSSGNSQNDATVKQITSGITGFLTQIRTLIPGAQVPTGSLNVQAGTRDGIKYGYSGSLGNISGSAADAATAVQNIALAIAQNLTGVSDTLKTVLSNLTDPSQLQEAVQFAAAYDNLKKAADGALDSVENNANAVGPFQTAIENLNKTFGDLADKATQFGLALDPVNTGLQEATKRLQEDFGKALDSAINSANGDDYISQLTQVSQGFATNTRDAIAVGLGDDAATTAKIAQVERVQAAPILGGLDTAQLQKVIAATQTSNPEIAAMAQAILDAGTAATDTGKAFATLSDALKAIAALATSLKTGELSGLPPAEKAKTSRAEFLANYNSVLAGNASGTQLAALATSAQAALEASIAAFGQGPDTANLRNDILAALDYVSKHAGDLTGASTTAAIAAAQAAAAAKAGKDAVTEVQTMAVNATNVDINTNDSAFAAGTSFTPPGRILVGEKGPEWMGRKNGVDMGWTLVGQHGPEIINQAGGATILPFPITPDRAFADGTVPLPRMRLPMSTEPGYSEASVRELRALRQELAALRKQTMGGQESADTTARQQTGHLADINRKIGTGLREPMRRKVA